MKYWQKTTWHLVASHSQQPMSDLPLWRCPDEAKRRRNCRNRVYLLHLIRILSALVLKNLSLCLLGIQGAHLVQMLDDPAHSASDKTLSNPSLHQRPPSCHSVDHDDDKLFLAQAVGYAHCPKVSTEPLLNSVSHNSNNFEWPRAVVFHSFMYVYLYDLNI